MKHQQIISKCLENKCENCPIVYSDVYDLGFEILCQCKCHASEVVIPETNNTIVVKRREADGLSNHQPRLETRTHPLERDDFNEKIKQSPR